MTDTAVHPTYQHRHVDDDRLSIIVGEDDLGGLVRNGRALFFGYWRPHAFTELASLGMTAEGAFLKGIQADRFVPADRYDGDPDVLVSEWLAHAASARAMDMRDREDAVLRRRERDRSYGTRYAAGQRREGIVGDAPLQVRMAIQSRSGLVNGTWDGGTLLREVASLAWDEDGSVHLTAEGRKLTFQAPVDLDALAGAWLTFVSGAREELEYQDGLAQIRAASFGSGCGHGEASPAPTGSDPGSGT